MYTTENKLYFRFVNIIFLRLYNFSSPSTESTMTMHCVAWSKQLKYEVNTQKYTHKQTKTLYHITET